MIGYYVLKPGGANRLDPYRAGGVSILLSLRRL